MQFGGSSTARAEPHITLAQPSLLLPGLVMAGHRRWQAARRVGLQSPHRGRWRLVDAATSSGVRHRPQACMHRSGRVGGFRLRVMWQKSCGRTRMQTPGVQNNQALACRLLHSGGWGDVQGAASRNQGVAVQPSAPSHPVHLKGGGAVALSGPSTRCLTCPPPPPAHENGRVGAHVGCLWCGSSDAGGRTQEHSPGAKHGKRWRGRLEATVRQGDKARFPPPPPPSLLHTC